MWQKHGTVNSRRHAYLTSPPSPPLLIRIAMCCMSSVLCLGEGEGGGGCGYKFVVMVHHSRGVVER